MINFTDSVTHRPTHKQLFEDNDLQRRRRGRYFAKPPTKDDFFESDYQEIITDKYLALTNVKRRRIAQSWVTGMIENCIDWGYGPLTGISLAGRMSPELMATKSGGYAIINVLGQGGRHVMAAWIGEDSAFFDPNFGELYFSNRWDFRKFFETFWAVSGYQEAFCKFCFFLYVKGV